MESNKIRSDEPSGRQASEQPEHAGNPDINPSTLHQGQGPDFQTQDERLKKKNPGVKQINKNLGFSQAGDGETEGLAQGDQSKTSIKKDDE